MLERTPRQEKELEAMKYLNDNYPAFAPRLFDCGELGILHIFWMRSRWECQWYDELETLPEKG